MAWKYIDKVRTASGKWRYIYNDVKTAANTAIARARVRLKGGKNQEGSRGYQGHQIGKKLRARSKNSSSSYDRSQYYMHGGKMYNSREEQIRRRERHKNKKAWEFWK